MAFILWLVTSTWVASAADLALKIVPRFKGAPLEFDSLTNMTAAGQTISVTRLDFLLSNFALRSTNGAWIENTNWFAFISGREGKTGFQLAAPTGHFDRIRFHVGLPSSINHHDPAAVPANHPLNPEVNGLHWGWMGGYVFFALEGGWLRGDGAQSGYSYHVATDAQLMTVELPVTLNLSRSGNTKRTASPLTPTFAEPSAGGPALSPLRGEGEEIVLALNVDRVFLIPRKIVLNEETATTHSRTNDPLAAQLRAAVERAFAVESAGPFVVPALAGQPSRLPKPFVTSDRLKPGLQTRKIEIAPGATLYQLTILRFFPRPALPTDNPLTEEGVELGRQLFFDPRLSINNAQSCASCHVPEAAFTDGKNASTGAEGQVGTRNAMALLNLAWKTSFFWDGRAASLREQVLQPIQNPIEMHESLSNVVAKLSRTSNYAAAFEKAFGTREINSDRLARALEQFLLVQVSHNSRFDRALNGETKLTDEEQRGFELFHTEYDPRRGQFGADCFHCHGGPLFQSQNFANNGLDANFSDLGRYKVTHRDGDKGKFAVPSLRNVAVTRPYMHDGRFKTLEEVVEHYSSGVKRSATLDPNLAKHPDGGVPLSASDKQALVAFLKTLTDERFVPPLPTLAKSK